MKRNDSPLAIESHRIQLKEVEAGKVATEAAHEESGDSARPAASPTKLTHIFSLLLPFLEKLICGPKSTKKFPSFFVSFHADCFSRNFNESIVFFSITLT